MDEDSFMLSDMTVVPNEDYKAFRRNKREYAMNFVNRARILLSDEDYSAFLCALGKYQQDSNKNIIQTYQKVYDIFDGNENMLEDFRRYLPDASIAAAAQRATYLKQLRESLRDMIRKTSNNLCMVLFLLVSLVVLILGMWVSL